MKKLLGFILVLAMTMGMCITAYAEDTTDYTFKDDEVIDFCVYNTWGTMSVDCAVPEISTIKMTVTVSEFKGDPVDVKLYNRDQKSWLTWASEAQTISGDGTYTFFLDLGENKYESSYLATIYLKDVKCEAADVDPDGKGEETSGITAHFKLDSCKFNVPEVEETTPAETTEAPAADKNDAAATTAAAATDSDSSFPGWAKIVIPVAAVAVVAVVVIAVVGSKKKKAK